MIILLFLRHRKKSTDPIDSIFVEPKQQLTKKERIQRFEEIGTISQADITAQEAGKTEVVSRSVVVTTVEDFAKSGVEGE